MHCCHFRKTADIIKLFINVLFLLFIMLFLMMHIPSLLINILRNILWSSMNDSQSVIFYNLSAAALNTF